jgi:iron complex outermembrane recepter protein
VTESNDLPDGSRVQNVPRNTASLWTTYEIQNGDLQGFGFGFGLFYIDERAGDFSDTFDLPSYLRTDAAVFYRRNNWRAAINIQNLFDVEYFRSNNFGRVAIEPGAPFTIIGSLAVEF